jgi:uncharacterized protein (TIGR02145 family)
VTYAGTAGYMSTVTITLHKTTVPVDLRVNLAGTTGDSRIVNVISVPPYTDTRYPTSAPYKPVLKAGRYWAPLNVGAKEQTPVTTDVATSDQAGLFIQWGRTTGFYKDEYKDANANVKKDGPVAEDDPNYVAILSSTYNWLNRSDMDLWHGEKEQGPCPPGWKVPTRVECNEMIAVFGTKAAITADDRRFRTTGDNGIDILYFPVSGFFGMGMNASVMGDITYSTNNGSLWTADAHGTIDGIYLSLRDGTLSQIQNVASSARRSWPLPVRCIQQ